MIRRTIPIPEKKKKPFKRRIKVSSAKAKGRWLQDWACEKVSELLNIPWGREDDKLIQPRQMDQSGVDVVLRGCAVERLPYAIECSSGESWNVRSKIIQTRKNLKSPYKRWLLILKSNNFQKPIVVMDADHFFYLKACAMYGREGYDK